MMSKIFPFSDFMYLAQLEEYDVWRYLTLVKRFFFRRNIQTRGRLIYTQRALAIYSGSVAIWLWCVTSTSSLTIIAISTLAIPLLIVPPLLITEPIYGLLKLIKIRKATSLLRKGRTKVIVIAGSYGKTTVKNFLYQLLKPFYKTQMVGGNINSAIGIAQWILQNYQVQCQFLIVEVDSYALGRIARSVAMLCPDYTILTSIGDQHGERFGSKRNLATALLEIHTPCHKPQNHITTREVDQYIREQNIKTVLYHLAQSTEQATHLSKTQQQCLDLACSVAHQLEIKPNVLQLCKQSLTVPDRRQKLTWLHGFTTIDDSYNISYTTAISALTTAHELASKEKKNLLVLCAGIPELLPSERDRNQQLARAIGERATHTLLLTSIFAKEMAEVLRDANKSFSLHTSMSDAIQYLITSQDPKQTLLLQFPELTDLYY
ncbi:MAG: Mur ligase family protein [Methylacidiphilales bacterium]|nr:Mur ligase family protein [Candidatus Methylacidiphilales bacterium]